MRGLQLQFQFYGCTSQVCGGCYTTDRPECGFCLDANACVISSQCAGTWGGASCPAVSAISPTEGTHKGGTVVTLQGALFIQNDKLGACVLRPLGRACN